MSLAREMPRQLMEAPSGERDVVLDCGSRTTASFGSALTAHGLLSDASMPRGFFYSLFLVSGIRSQIAGPPT